MAKVTAATEIPGKVQLMVDGELQDALVRIDGKGDWVCKTTSGRVFHFSPTERVNTNPESEETTEEDRPISLADQIARHNAANSERPVFAHEVGPDPFDEEWENFDAAAREAEA